MTEQKERMAGQPERAAKQKERMAEQPERTAEHGGRQEASARADGRCREIERSIIKTFRKEIWRPFVKALNEYDLIQEGDHIAVCISGGKDSMLLAKCMQEILRHGKMEFGLHFLVMDPGYNPEQHYQAVQPVSQSRVGRLPQKAPFCRQMHYADEPFLFVKARIVPIIISMRVRQAGYCPPSRYKGQTSDP